MQYSALQLRKNAPQPPKQELIQLSQVSQVKTYLMHRCIYLFGQPINNIKIWL